MARLAWVPALGLALAVTACGPRSEPDGVVILELEGWGTAARAGLETGDILTGWSTASAAEEDDPEIQPLRSPLDLVRVEVEESPRHPVVLHGRRGSRRIEVAPAGGEWEVTARPTLPVEERAREERAARHAEEGDLGAAGELRRALADDALASGRTFDAAWFLLRQADALVAHDDPPSEEELHARAATLYGRAQELLPDAPTRASALYHRCLSWVSAGRAKQAEAACSAASEAWARIDPHSPAGAAARVHLTRALYRQRRLDVDEVPAGALATYERYPNSHIERAKALYIRGAITAARREFERAEPIYREALTLREAIGGPNPWRANLLANLGNLRMVEGDLAAAQELCERSLAMNEQLDPGSVDTAYSLNLVGVIARRQGHHETSRLYIERALAIFERELPGGLETAGMHNNLGNIALMRGDLAAAERSHRQAIELRREIQPGTLNLAQSLNNLGSTLRRMGKTAEARELLEESLAIKTEQIPNSQHVAGTLTELGWIAQEDGDLDAGRQLHQRAMELRRSFGESSWIWAENLFELGEIARLEGRPEEAARLWGEAVTAVERQRRFLAHDALGGARFTARFQRFYRALADLRVESGQAVEAFDLLESARAQTLRALLAERQIAPAGAVPPELARERYRLARSASGVLARLERLDAEGDAEAGRELHERLLEVRARQREIDLKIAQRAPRFAALRDAPPVTLAAVRRTLEPGSVLLSYSVGPASTLLFVVRSDRDPGPPLDARRIAAGRSDLQSRIEIFRALVDRGRRSSTTDPALLDQGRRLYDLLLAPAADALEAAERVIVVPDLPLADAPFAAFVRPSAADSKPEFVAAWKPLSYAASGGVLTELAAATTALSRPRSEPAPLLIFADATSEGSAGAEPILPALPWARREAQQIAGLYPGARVWTGEEATEARLVEELASLAAADSASPRLHFAVHGLLADRFPLDSALLLAPEATGNGAGGRPDDRDGRLHAWEVIERLRLDTDLVTLSACESGLGGEVDGEGIVGLARAFQIAGARSLMVTDWTVPDRGTFELMTRFYSHLRDGLSKTEALARAQAEVARGDAGTDLVHPFHWAGVRLLGSPR